MNLHSNLHRLLKQEVLDGVNDSDKWQQFRFRLDIVRAAPTLITLIEISSEKVQGQSSMSINGARLATQTITELTQFVHNFDCGEDKDVLRLKRELVKMIDE